MTLQAALDPSRSLVLIVDIQERLAAAMESADCIEQASRLVFGASALDVPVIVSEQYPQGLGPTVAALEIGNAPRFAKTVFDASQVPDLMKYIDESGRDQVIVGGMEAHICVHQTVRGLSARGPQVVVAADATCSRNPDHRRLAENLWRPSAQVSCVEAVLFDWLGEAGGDAFKAISKRIR